MAFETSVRVRFRDTDMYGHVNNASYATYMEESRIQFMEAHFGGFNVPLILASAAYQFRQQTKFPEHRDIRAVMWVTRIGTASADIMTQLISEEGLVLCECLVTVVHFDYEQQKASPIPPHVRDVFLQYVKEDGADGKSNLANS